MLSLVLRAVGVGKLAEIWRLINYNTIFAKLYCDLAKKKKHSYLLLLLPLLLLLCLVGTTWQVQTPSTTTT